MWAFQYVQQGADVVLKHVAAGGAVEATTALMPGTTLPTDYTNELTLGGWRTGAVNTFNGGDGGGEHGECTLHEVLITRGPLTDAELAAVHGALRSRWRA